MKPCILEKWRWCMTVISMVICLWCIIFWILQDSIWEWGTKDTMDKTMLYVCQVYTSIVFCWMRWARNGFLTTNWFQSLSGKTGRDAVNCSVSFSTWGGGLHFITGLETASASSRPSSILGDIQRLSPCKLTALWDARPSVWLMDGSWWISPPYLIWPVIWWQGKHGHFTNPYQFLSDPARLEQFGRFYKVFVTCLVDISLPPVLPSDYSRLVEIDISATCIVQVVLKPGRHLSVTCSDHGNHSKHRDNTWSLDIPRTVTRLAVCVCVCVCVAAVGRSEHWRHGLAGQGGGGEQEAGSMVKGSARWNRRSYGHHHRHRHSWGGHRIYGPWMLMMCFTNMRGTRQHRLQNGRSATGGYGGHPHSCKSLWIYRRGRGHPPWGKGRGGCSWDRHWLLHMGTSNVGWLQSIDHSQSKSTHWAHVVRDTVMLVDPIPDIPRYIIYI